MITLKQTFQAYSVHDDSHQWAVAGIPVEIWFHTGALRRIGYDLSYIGKNWGEQKEIGGLLLGSRNRNTLKVMTVETYCSTTLQQLLNIVKSGMSRPSNLSGDRSIGAREHEVLGYYRLLPGLCEPSVADVSVFRDYFNPETVFLMLGGGGSGDARFVFAKNDEVAAADVKFPGIPEALDEEPGKSDAAGDGQGWRKRLMWVGVSGAAILSTVVIGAWLQREFSGGASGVPGASQASSIAGEAGSGVLGLTGRMERGGARLTWKPASIDIPAASRSVLSIVDGDEHLDVPLSAALLGAGSFWYSPRTDTVQFTLEIAQADGKQIRESATVSGHRPDSAPVAGRAAALPGGQPVQKTVPSVPRQRP
jgi:hypothetical protein